MRNLLCALSLFLSLGLMAQLPANIDESVLLEDTTLSDSEGDEQVELDDLDTKSGFPEWLQPHIQGDTLFVACDAELLPRRIVVMTNDGQAYYKLMPLMLMGDSAWMKHPADSVYNHVWTDARVNPYGVALTSLPGDVTIDMHGFTLPHHGYVTSHFGFRRYRYHYGTDIKVLVGDTLRAAWDGQVRIVGWDPRGYGYYVVLRHDNGLETVYGHMSRPLVEEYDFVKSGDVIGLGGNTGRSTGSHLHFEIRYLGNPIDPETVVNFDNGLLRNPDTFTISVKEAQAKAKEMAQQQFHKVRSGETLSSIARKYHTSVKALCKLNNMKESSILREGRKLRVR